MAKHSYEEVEGQLLDSDEVELDSQFSHQKRRSSWQRTCDNAYRLFSFCLMAYIASMVTFPGAFKRSCSCQAEETAAAMLAEEDERRPSLVPEEHVQYVVRPEWVSLRHPWNLPPSKELDRAWDKLLYALNVRVSPDELDMINENSTNRVRVEDGDYAAVIGVYHHMHCLNNLRRIVHWDYYGPLLAKAKGFNPEGYTKEHSGHCIDSIRQALMCHANTDIYTIEWVDDDAFPVAPDLRSKAVAKCVDWNHLDSWARQRALLPGRFHTLPGPFPSSAVKKNQDELS
ncbi:hypothetical protein QBC37DRAFT_338389 [Rhypophila decipiens]|uniref:Tat pathway signal sequence n=1 Tax=Rhypophila decipiens TaxID=261697 RepID=A0AAN6YCX6_9PEZI|nr:hypothetical protein QBC37DRAFT_338389 [Rhypophila decipiens]